MGVDVNYNREKIIDTLKEIYEESLQIKPYVVVAQPRRDVKETPAQNLQGYTGLHVDFCGFSHGYAYTDGLPIDVARNTLIEQTLDAGSKYLLFVDEDTVLPYYAFTVLHQTAEENPNSIVAGVYYIKLSVPMIMVREENFIIPANIDPGKIIEVFQIGMGCCLIPVKILEEMKRTEPDLPFCCVSPEGFNGMPFIGEDNFFIYRARKMGVKVLVNTNVQCIHMDLASGKYTAHPDIKLEDYFTNIPITDRLIMKDKKYVDERWVRNLPTFDSSSQTESIDEEDSKL